MKTLSLIVFVVSSLIHLYGSFLDDARIRRPSKVFIMLGLLGYYCTTAENIKIIVVLAIITSWLGDIFLIPKGSKWLLTGGIFFMFSHFCFMMAYYPQIQFDKLNLWILIPISLIYIYIVHKEFFSLKPYMKKALYYTMILYLMINAANNLFAWMQYLSNGTTVTLIILLGAILFFISDTMLFLVRFHEKDVVPKRHFLVMLTYIIAEFLIVYGLICL